MYLKRRSTKYIKELPAGKPKEIEIVNGEPMGPEGLGLIISLNKYSRKFLASVNKSLSKPGRPFIAYKLFGGYVLCVPMVNFKPSGEKTDNFSDENLFLPIKSLENNATNLFAIKYSIIINTKDSLEFLPPILDKDIGQKESAWIAMNQITIEGRAVNYLLETSKENNTQASGSRVFLKMYTEEDLEKIISSLKNKTEKLKKIVDQNPGILKKDELKKVGIERIMRFKTSQDENEEGNEIRKKMGVKKRQN